MIVITCAVLGCIAGFLFGTQLERDRQHALQRNPPPTPLPLPDKPISDREWEQFVVAIYDLADGGETQE